MGILTCFCLEAYAGMHRRTALDCPLRANTHMRSSNLSRWRDKSFQIHSKSPFTRFVRAGMYRREPFERPPRATTQKWSSKLWTSDVRYSLEKKKVLALIPLL